MRGRRGFILLFGTKPMISTDGNTPPVHAVCPRCGQRADIVAKSYRTWFTLFFIPVFPVSGSKKFSECSRCGAQFPLETAQLRQNIAAVEQEYQQRAIQLYNSLRNSPANSVTLNELMTLYASIEEYDQAISAAREFSAALDASEQCMVTMGRLYLAKHDHAEAIKWFDAAIARNQTLGEAYYYKAVGYLTDNPPQPDKAIPAARTARSHGYANADQLLKDAESAAARA